jgi:(p)ppGpp synthase/HD superfamily hydrolase
LKAAGWCHDIAEDCYSDWETAYKALSGAGIDKDVIALVRHLTRAKDMSYADYIAHIGRNIDACRVKLADLEHNLETLKHEPRNNQRRDKYMLAHLYLKHIVEDARLTANE